MGLGPAGEAGVSAQSLAVTVSPRGPGLAKTRCQSLAGNIAQDLIKTS